MTKVYAEARKGTKRRTAIDAMFECEKDNVPHADRPAKVMEAVLAAFPGEPFTMGQAYTYYNWLIEHSFAPGEQVVRRRGPRVTVAATAQSTPPPSDTTTIVAVAKAAAADLTADGSEGDEAEVAAELAAEMKGEADEAKSESQPAA